MLAESALAGRRFCSRRSPLLLAYTLLHRCKPPIPSYCKQYPYDIHTEAFSYEIFKQAFVAVQSFVVHLQISLLVMDNNDKPSKEEVDNSQDSSYDFDSSSDESDDMAEVNANTAEANAINVDGTEKLITDLTSEDVWGLTFDNESEVCDFYAKYAKCHGFVSRKDVKSVDANGNINTRQLVCNRAGVRHWKHFKRENRQREHKPITRVN